MRTSWYVISLQVLKAMRKLDWKDAELRRFTAESLVAVWNVKYSNTHCVASLLAGLAPYHVRFPSLPVVNVVV